MRIASKANSEVNPDALGFTIRPNGIPGRAANTRCYIRRSSGTIVLVLDHETALGALEVSHDLNYVGVLMSEDGRFILGDFEDKRKLSIAANKSDTGSGRISIGGFAVTIGNAYGCSFDKVYLEPEVVATGDAIILTPTGEKE